MTTAAVLVWGACALEAAAAIHVLVTGHPIVLRSAELLPLTGVDLVLNPLGALFVLLVAMVAVPATLHGIGYARHGLDSRTAACLFPIFVTTLLLVPSAGSVATFMVLWELMALTSLALGARGPRPEQGGSERGLLVRRAHPGRRGPDPRRLLGAGGTLQRAIVRRHRASTPGTSRPGCEGSSSCSPSSASGRRPASCPFTYGCPRLIPKRRARSPRSCRGPWWRSGSTGSSWSVTTSSVGARCGGGW